MKRFACMLAAASALLVPSMASAETFPIVVTATGSAEVNYDGLSVPVRFTSDTQGSRSIALDVASKRVITLKKALEDFGLKANVDFKLGEPSAWAKWSGDYKQIVGYTGNFEATVHIPFTLVKADEAFDYLKRVYSVSGYSSALSKARTESATEQAQKALGAEAQAKAEKIAAGFKCKIVGVISVEEISDSDGYRPRTSARSIGAPPKSSIVTEAAETERTHTVNASAKVSFRCDR